MINFNYHWIFDNCQSRTDTILMRLLPSSSTRAFWRKAFTTAGGAMCSMSPAFKPISLRMLELRNEYSWLAIRQTVSIEATALAAGHRPCFECRRADALAFAAAWARGHALSPPPRAAEIDAALHAQRTAPPEVRAVGPLPPGTVFGHGEAFFLRLPGGAAQWDFAGYRPAPPIAGDTTVTPWTPAGSRAALAAGYRPALHPSAARYLSAR
jgi:hypothetical protein